MVVSLDSDPVKGMARTYPTLPQIDPLKLNHASKIPIDNFCRRMIRLCNIVKAHEATGKMIQMGVQLGGKGVGKVVCNTHVQLIVLQKCAMPYDVFVVIFLFLPPIYLADDMVAAAAR